MGKDRRDVKLPGIHSPVVVGRSVIAAGPASDWTSWELRTKQPEGESGADWAPRWPVQKELAKATGQDMATIFARMRVLEAHKFPPDLPYVEYEPCDKKKPLVYVLKCKPTCWRLYFSADRQREEFLYLLAVCKKQWPRDSDDCRVARKRLLRYEKGEFDRERIELPLP